MMSKNIDKKREQIQFFSMDDLVPQKHLLRDIERSIDFDFIYDLVKDRYSTYYGRPSIDPVMLIKIPLIQYMYGIKSMRQTIKEIEVNVAYRWFLGLSVTDKVPHFTTFGKNYSRRFKNTDLFEQIFEKILEECFKYNFIDTETIFVDATHIKACANNKKTVRVVANKEALFYEKDLKKEIKKDREIRKKKPLKGKKKIKNREIAESTSDPESGLFHKGEHKKVFAYSVQTACDKYGWILGYTVHKGNEHDSRTFPSIYEEMRKYNYNSIVMDAGYKTPSIARLVLEDGKIPIFPYKRPMTKKGFFKKREFVYDEFYDCYICPNIQILKYSTTTREGYKEYKSDKKICKNCKFLDKCTHSKNHQKVVIRHMWKEYMEKCEDIRHTLGVKQIYNKIKETIERIFVDVKENHGMRYTQNIGKAQMEMKVGLTFACINLKKLAKLKRKRGLLLPLANFIFAIILKNIEINKANLENTPKFALSAV
jgi:transposase